MKIVARLIAFVLACALSAFDTAVFYWVGSSFFGHHFTWPVVFAVFWVQESTFAGLIRKELREEGLL